MKSDKTLQELVRTYLNEEMVCQYDRTVHSYRRRRTVIYCSTVCAFIVCIAMTMTVVLSRDGDGMNLRLASFESHSVKEAEAILTSFFQEGPDVEGSIVEFLDSYEI